METIEKRPADPWSLGFSGDECYSQHAGKIFASIVLDMLARSFAIAYPS
jgi:hypothetical protein